ncbi:MAG: phosphoenolpyruvate--protein phosphotransferase [Candidatus Fermentibacter daniensis]|nr:phosphoenolpyruvate--protein phosphotransferase [Candidatus Fermentibacter daniensis]
MSRSFEGTAASPGIAIGPAFLLDVEELRVPRREIASDEEVLHEIARLDKALVDTRAELSELAGGMGDLVAGRQILDVHLMLIDDPEMLAGVRRRIRERRDNAEHALSQVLFDIIDRFRRMEDPYARERASDVRDVGRRLMSRLMGSEREALGRVSSPVILVSRELDPSVAAGLRRDQVLGFATDEGGSTSHTAILARSMGIPAVVALREAAEYIQPGTTVIVDGIHGRVVIDPQEDEIAYFTRLRKSYAEMEAALALSAEEPAVTADGIPFELAGNIEFSQEADQVRKYGGRGIGLFRTEFLRLISPDADDEEIQYRAYSYALRAMKPDPVVIRTLDLGGDKFPGAPELRERNPFLGWRAIRICLDRPEILRKQLRAILRASVEGRAWLMIPMVTELDQVLRTREMIRDIERSLESEGIPFDPAIPLGMMVETPAAAIGIDIFLPHVDFVSIGTNDLTQYTLAVDRGSPFVAHLFDSLHPAVLRQIDHVVKKCHEAGRWVGVCGQIAGEPLAVPILLGLGVDELSVSISLIPNIKKMIGAVDTGEARDLARRALSARSALEVRQLTRSYVQGRFPTILLDGLSGSED